MTKESGLLASTPFCPSTIATQEKICSMLKAGRTFSETWLYAWNVPSAGR